MTDSNDSFLREIEQEISQERYKQLWDRYGLYALGAVALLVVGILGFQYHKRSSEVAAETAGAEYAAAQQKGSGEKASIGAKVAAANAFKDLAEDGPVGYASLAQLQLAGARMETGKMDEALKLFEDLSKKSGVDPLLKEFASLQAATLRIGDADFTEMQNRLTPLATEKSAWRHSALQLLGIAASKAGKNDVARPYFERLLADPEAPPSVRQRASLFMTQIAVADDVESESGKDKEPAASSAKTGGGTVDKASGSGEPVAKDEKSGPEDGGQ